MFFDLTNWWMVFLRVSAVLVLFPLFSMQSIPVQVRLALAALLSCLIAPTLPALEHLPGSFVGFILLMVKEIGVGLLLGFVIRLIFHILEFGGSVVASELGLNSGATFNPLSHSRSEAPGLVLFWLGAIIFLTLNLHHWLLMALQRS